MSSSIMLILSTPYISLTFIPPVVSSFLSSCTGCREKDREHQLQHWHKEELLIQQSRAIFYGKRLLLYVSDDGHTG
jgi:hypothetical protein